MSFNKDNNTSSNFDYAAKCWENRLNEEISKHGSRAAFARKVNEAKNDSTRYDGSHVLRWITGAKSGSFPKLATMFDIADCLEVDLGYLLGWTDFLNQDLSSASNALNLSIEATNKIYELTGKHGFLRTGKPAHENSAALEALLSSEAFASFLAAIAEAREAWLLCVIEKEDDLRNIWSECVKKYGAETWAEASHRFQELEDLRIGSSNVNMSDNLIDAMLDYEKFDAKAYSYELNWEEKSQLVSFRIFKAGLKLAEELVPPWPAEEIQKSLDAVSANIESKIAGGDENA